MTEFELLQVEYMKKEYATNLVDNMYGSIAAMGDQATVIFTLIFGYLLVAHFIGSQLSRGQLIVLNICYLTMTIRLTMHTLSHSYALGLFMEEYLAVLELEFEEPLAVQIWDKFDRPWWYFVYIIASLYYMWSVRRPKSE